MGWKQEMYNVVGAIYAVRQELGLGLNESCYQEGLQIELSERGIPFQREAAFHPIYRGHVMETSFRIDFLCYDKIIVECKSVESLQQVHRAQLFNYMRLLRKPCGVLVNFAPTTAQVERYLLDDETGEIQLTDGRVVGSY